MRRFVPIQGLAIIALVVLAAPVAAQQAAPAPAAIPAMQTPPAPEASTRRVRRAARRAALANAPMQLLQFFAHNGKPPPNAPGASAVFAPRAKVNPAPHGAYDAMIANHAQANGVPEALIHRVIRRESRYDPAAIGRGGAMGLMQIKHATARSLGYGGTPQGLLDPNTNLTYAVRYLAGAFRAANGDPDRAYSYFRTGYYKSRRTGTIVRPRESRAAAAAAAPAATLASPPSAPPGGFIGLHGVE